MRFTRYLATVVFLTASLALTSAATLFTTTLTPGQENPSTTGISSGTGIGTILLNDAQNSITVNFSFSGLTTPAVAGHIHIIPTVFGDNGPVVFGFTGVPNATAGAIPQQIFAVNPTQITALYNNLWYFNVHTTQFGGGEIRGNVIASAPEPASFVLFGSALAALGLRRWRRRVQ